jgi:hypothetical protein
MYHPTFLLLLLFLLMGCDHGLVPPDDPARGAISGTITYEGPWPDVDSLIDIRFVALRIIPEEADDIIREFEQQRVVLSQGLTRSAVRDTFLVGSVITGPYVYSGIAVQQSSNLFDWRPVGLYSENAGIFQVLQDDTTRIQIHVDFNNLPPFPPVSN